MLRFTPFSGFGLDLMVSYKEAPDRQKMNLTYWQMLDCYLHFKADKTVSEVKSLAGGHTANSERLRFHPRSV